MFHCGGDSKFVQYHVRHCLNDTACPRVENEGDGLKIWRVGANVLNKESRTADKG